jgi:hypothetical protein
MSIGKLIVLSINVVKTMIVPMLMIIKITRKKNSLSNDGITRAMMVLP